MRGASEGGATGVITVALIGFMAVGKSAVGRLVARRLGVSFVDTDALIEQREGPVSEIFAERGEQTFRALERDVVWLTAPQEVLWARASNAPHGGRPLAADEQAFGRLFEDRRELYGRVATAEVVNDGSRALTAVADEIVALAVDGGLHPASKRGEDRE